MTTDVNAFQAGADFISFDSATTVLPNLNGHINAQAGPSRLLPINNGQSGGKRKFEQRLEDQIQIVRGQNGNRETHGEGKAKGNPKKTKFTADGDTGPKNLKEEKKAAERHAPWSDLVDWEQCHDPAEMYAIHSIMFGLINFGADDWFQVECGNHCFLSICLTHTSRVRSQDVYYRNHFKSGT